MTRNLTVTLQKLSQSMLSLLECPVCLTPITKSPIPCCSNGHTLCSECWTRSHFCPVCRTDLHTATKCFSQTANSLLEIIPGLPCTNQHLGCSFSSPLLSLEAHQLTCPYNTHQPQQVNMTSKTCCPIFFWRGKLYTFQITYYRHNLAARNLTAVSDVNPRSWEWSRNLVSVVEKISVGNTSWGELWSYIYYM